MTSCLGFDLTGFNICDGWECWSGWDQPEECDEHVEYSSLNHRVALCDDFTSLIGFDDDSVMESMDEDCI